MTNLFDGLRKRIQSAGRSGDRTSIATKLTLNYLLIIAIISVVFTAAGIWLISNRIVSEAQEKVRHDLNSAREIYHGKLNHINDVVRLNARRSTVVDAVTSGNMRGLAVRLEYEKNSEGLDLLSITDPNGIVLLRANQLESSGDSQIGNELVAAVIRKHVPVASTIILSLNELEKESQELADQAHIPILHTPMEMKKNETVVKNGMVLMAAAPIFDEQGRFIGVLYGGTLLNRNYEIVDDVKSTVFEGMKYENRDIGTATIFQDDVRVSTNVVRDDGSRAIGTRVSEEVYNHVIVKGEPWIGRAYVVNSWYISAYEPIRDLDGEIVGILYVGILEEKYDDLRRQTILVFLGIAFLGMSISIAPSYLISQRISAHIKELVLASRDVAHGNLNAKVKKVSNDELGELAETFNAMAAALKDRDEKLKEFTRNKIMESERLALIGQLSANVAHELNNPMQGIVTYSHLLLEAVPPDDPCKESLEKIVIQANRCRDIIRGLLDFSRQRKPDKMLCDINNVLQGCISLLEGQILFQNIQLEVKLDEHLPQAVIDPSQIERVFMNIMINATQAMDSSGRLTLTTSFEEKEGFIDVEFADTGCGIDKENLEKIFDPFFTTKDTGHGVGLGLAISYGIIKEHKGTISVESEIGKGTRFTVRLPVATEELENNG